MEILKFKLILEDGREIPVSTEINIPEINIQKKENFEKCVYEGESGNITYYKVSKNWKHTNQNKIVIMY